MKAILPSMVLLCFANFATAADWPRFLGPAQTGVSAETELNLNWEKHPLAVLWRYKTGSSYSPPVVAAGKLYVFHRRRNEEVLDALDAQTGIRLWRHSYATTYKDRYGYSNGPRGSPTVDGDLVLIFGTEGRLRCLEASDGSLRWEREVNREFNVPQNFFGAGTAPVVYDDRVMINAGGKDGHGVMAFSLHTGKTLWTATDDAASYATPITLDVSGTPALACLTRSHLRVLGIADGTEVCAYPFRAEVNESVNAASPVRVGDSLLITAAYKVGSALIGANSAAEVWRSQTALEGHWATPIFHDGYIYGCHGRHESGADIRCLDAKDGRVAWKSPRGLGRSTLLMVQEHIIVLGERGHVALLEVTPNAYTEVSRRKNVLGHPAWAPPVVANGLLYLRDEHQVVCLDLRPPQQ